MLEMKSLSIPRLKLTIILLLMTSALLLEMKSVSIARLKQLDSRVITRNDNHLK